MIYIQGWLEVIVAFGILIIYLMNYFLFGFAFATICKKEKKNFGFCMVSGFFIYSLVFGIFVLPLKTNVISLNIISEIWSIVWLLTILLIIICCWKELKKHLKFWKQQFVENKIVIIIFSGITVIQLIFEELYGRYTNGSGAAWFNAYVSAAVFDNYLGITHPVSGEKMKYFYEAYFLQTYNDHSAVISKLTKLSPLIETRTVMSTVVIIIGNLLIYELAKSLFKESKKQYRIVFFILYIAVMGIFVPCVYLPSYYYYFRAFEGKNIFGMLLIPFVVVCLLKLYDKPNNGYVQKSLVLGLLGSYTFCMSTMYILPCIFLSYIPMVFYNKKMFKNLCVGLIPCIAVMGYYMLIRQGVITLTIR